MAPEPDRAAAARAAGYRVRPLRVEDSDELGTMHAQIWFEAYRGIYSEQYLAARDPQRLAQQWRTRALEPLGSLTRAIAVAPDGTLAGFAVGGPTLDDDAPLPDALYSLNVLARHYGTGVADLLIDAVVGRSPRTLWMVAANDRARAFYRRHGFAEEGARRQAHESGVDEIRLIRGR